VAEAPATGAAVQTGASAQSGPPVRLERHARHVLLKEIGGAGQQRLARATVALVGMGGLGAPAALYLAAAGVGRLVLIDPDVVELSNLQRQVLYATDDLGRRKVDAAGAALAALDPGVRLDLHPQALTDANAEALLAGCDVVLDGTDSFAVRFAVNAAAHRLGIPLVSGAVGRWEGQVGVFASGSLEDAPCYRCLVPEAPPGAALCGELGVVGALTGVVGSMMALEAVKLLTGAGQPLVGRLWLYDGLAGTSRTVRIARDPACPCCGETVSDRGAG
jgi:molybdopterin-synthase adenylyltransferase